MAGERETTRLQVTLAAETGRKISELAERLNVSDSKMVELLIDASIEDNEWIIKLVTGRWAKALREVLGGPARKRKRLADGA